MFLPESTYNRSHSLDFLPSSGPAMCTWHGWSFLAPPSSDAPVVVRMHCSYSHGDSRYSPDCTAGAYGNHTCALSPCHSSGAVSRLASRGEDALRIPHTCRAKGRALRTLRNHRWIDASRRHPDGAGCRLSCDRVHLGRLVSCLPQPTFLRLLSLAASLLAFPPVRVGHAYSSMCPARLGRARLGRAGPGCALQKGENGSRSAGKRHRPPDLRQQRRATLSAASALDRTFGSGAPQADVILRLH